MGLQQSLELLVVRNEPEIRISRFGLLVWVEGLGFRVRGCGFRGYVYLGSLSFLGCVWVAGDWLGQVAYTGSIYTGKTAPLCAFSRVLLGVSETKDLGLFRIPNLQLMGALHRETHC